MKHIKSFLNSFTIKLILFSLAFVIGVSVSVLFFLTSKSPELTPVEINQTTGYQDDRTFQVEVKILEDDVPQVVQMEVVDFPVNGRVIVESVEQIGKFPQMVFRSEKTGEVLLRSLIEDEEEWLIPEKNSIGTPPALRFHTIDSKDFKSPIIMSVAIDHGGSDNHFYMTIFGELNGNIARLNEEPLFTNMQGGYYLGHLNKKVGYGLAVWNFNWGGGEAHDSPHHYNIEIYKIQKGKLKQVVKKVSKKKYDCDKHSDSLRELGIKATDQRKEIPRIKENIY